jgi:hypothetical protein
VAASARSAPRSGKVTADGEGPQIVEIPSARTNADLRENGQRGLLRH